MDYKTGDFVMLKDVQKFSDNRPLHRNFNVFEISEILSDGFRLKYIGETVSKDDVLPIPVNGEDDRWIYYDPIIAAAVVRPGDDLPCHSTDYTYYLNAFARSYAKDGKSLQELVREKGFIFVHEIQHYLKHPDYLKINSLMI